MRRAKQDDARAERILRVLRETGARKRLILDALAGGDRGVLDRLRAEGKVKIVGARKGARYAAA